MQRRHSIACPPRGFIVESPRETSSTSAVTSEKDDSQQDELAPKAMVVAVRIRPLSGKETESGQKSCITIVNGQTIAIKRQDSTSTAGYLKSQMAAINEYGFDAAFDEHATQMQVYQATAKPFIPNLLAGLNVTVFAYGATGSGKTHTMLGNTRADEAAGHAEGGIIPLTVNDLFAHIDARRAVAAIGETWTVSVTFVEIYNEQVYDLLEPTGKILQLREDQEKGTVVVAGVVEQATPSAKAVFDMLARGNGNRKTEATMANQVSSRSHAVLQLTLRHSRRNEAARDITVESKLSLIDLAGSERASATNNRGARLQEGANINKSLLALGNCINSLASNAGASRRTNVKYRDSRLTHLLKSSLEGGRCNLVMIANVNPSDLTYEDSHNTLKYANRAKQIKVDARATAITVESTWVEREARLREENARLRERVAVLEALVSSLTSSGAQVGFTDATAELIEEDEAAEEAVEEEGVPEPESMAEADDDDVAASLPLDQSIDNRADVSGTQAHLKCVLEEVDVESETVEPVQEVASSSSSSSSKKRPREEDRGDEVLAESGGLSDSTIVAMLDSMDADATVEDAAPAAEVEVEVAVPNKKRRGSLLPKPKTRGEKETVAVEPAPALPMAPTQPAPSDRRTRRNTISAPRSQQDENHNPQIQSVPTTVDNAAKAPSNTNTSASTRRKSLAAVSALLDALPDTDCAAAEASKVATRSSVSKVAAPLAQRGLSMRRKSVGTSQQAAAPVAHFDGWTPNQQVYIDI